MNIAAITAKATKIASRGGLLLKKYSPEILLTVGIVGTVGGAILACRATLRVEEVLDEHNAKVSKVKECWAKVEDGEISIENYSQKDYKKDLTVIYTQTTVEFIKLYGPAVTLGMASIACILGGHNIMRKRNVALMAAYKAVEEGFAAYRQRVIEDQGEEKDYMYKHGFKAEQVVETVVDEDGKSHKVKKTVLVKTDPNQVSQYARFFDESCREWCSTPEYNRMFLQSQQNYFNNALIAKGHLFLNEVYEALGMPHSPAGAVVGWILSKDGNNFVDFGLFDGNRDKVRDFINGNEPSILLDFNVDGVIWDKI